MKFKSHHSLLLLVILMIGYSARSQQNNQTATADTKNLSIYKETNDLGVEIYPNPCVNAFSVQFDNPHPDKVEVQLMDVNYAVISHRTHDVSYKGTVSFEFDVSALPSGIYFVHVATREGKSTLKFMKQ